MNRILGYEPYEGFEIHVFSRGEGKDFFGRPCNLYQGWAKRTSDGRAMDGSVVRSFKDAEDEMKDMINIIIEQERRQDEGLPVGEPAPSALLGFR